MADTEQIAVDPLERLAIRYLLTILEQGRDVTNAREIALTWPGELGRETLTPDEADTVEDHMRELASQITNNLRDRLRRR